MTTEPDTDRKSTDVSAFEHYLRTGEQLTASEWDARFERKFNPNHDPENGQFTFSPGGPKASVGTGRATGAARAAATAPVSRVRSVATFPETGKDAWRKANDAKIEKAANDFNTENGLKVGDARYMDPQLMKVWAMVETGGSKDAFLSDPFQVNNAGDWEATKLKIGLEKGKPPGPTLSAYAALRWLDKKGRNTIVFNNGTKTTTYRGLPYAFFNYNGRNQLDANGKPHKYNYVHQIFLLYKTK